MPTPTKQTLRALGQSLGGRKDQANDREWQRASQRDICAHPLFVEFGKAGLVPGAGFCLLLMLASGACLWC